MDPRGAAYDGAAYEGQEYADAAEGPPAAYAEGVAYDASTYAEAYKEAYAEYAPPAAYGASYPQSFSREEARPFSREEARQGPFDRYAYVPPTYAPREANYREPALYAPPAFAMPPMYAPHAGLALRMTRTEGFYPAPYAPKATSPVERSEYQQYDQPAQTYDRAFYAQQYPAGTPQYGAGYAFPQQPAYASPQPAAYAQQQPTYAPPAGYSPPAQYYSPQQMHQMQNMLQHAPQQPSQPAQPAPQRDDSGGWFQRVTDDPSKKKNMAAFASASKKTPDKGKGKAGKKKRKKDWDSEDEPELESEEDEAEDDMISGEEDDDEGFRPKPKKKAPPKGRPARSERALQRSERKADPASAAAADAAAAVAAAAVEFVENFDDDDDEADDAVDAEHTLAKCAEFSERLMLEFRKSISAGDEGAHALSAASMDAMLGNGAPREAGAFNPATMAEVNSVCAASLRLREHQLVGVNWLLLMERVGANGVLADDMGLGKTVQTICYLALSRARRKAAGNPHKGMDAVVVPASTLANWLAEFKRFAPATNVVVYHGALADRATQRAKYRVGSGIDVVLTTYTWWERDQCQDDRKFFGDNSPWNHVVLDEGHSLKNPRASRTRRLKALKSTSRTILSGTPIQNDTMDVLSLLSYLMPDLFTDTDGLLALAGQMASGDGSFERLRQLLAPFVLRRVKAQVLASLPPKTTHVLRVSLEQAQRAIYVGVTAKHVAAKRRRSAAAAEGAVLSFDDAQARNVFSELRKAANHPLLLRSKYNAEALAAIATVALHRGHFGKAATAAMVSTELEGYSDLDLHEICVEYAGDLGARALRTDDLYDSAKFSALRDLLPKLKQQGHRVLLFSQWVRLLDLLQLLCTDLGLKTCRLDGSTPVAERQELVLQFNAEASDLDVFLLSTRAGGLGLNLAGADTVVIHDVDFNPEVDRQAEDRAHRIGQTRDVTVYKLVSDETVDDDILQIAQRKREVNEKVLRADDDDGAKPNADVPPRAAVASAIARALREYEHHERAAAEIAAAESAAPA